MLIRASAVTIRWVPARWQLAATFAVLIGLLALATSAPAVAQADWDRTKIVGPNACAECHKKTVVIWQNTKHFKTFTDLPRRKEANEIAGKMGLKRIKADSLCLDCHFTTVVKDAERDPIAGISCESCHAPGKDYSKRHSEFSGKKKDTESKEEAAKRWADSEAAGMIRPHMLYRLAKNCYSCHVVPQEKLVNVGGHTAGSAFELVSWSQGEIRHNVWYSDGKSNPNASAERKRMMYIVGLGVELETALRAVGEASEKANYAVSMAKRAKAAQIQFEKVAAALPVPEVKDLFTAATSAGLKLNNRAELNAAADKVAAAAQAIAAKYDGSTFGAIDGLIPGEDKYKGTPATP